MVGFAVAGPSTSDGVDADFELFVLNVRQAHRGTGLAQQLHDRAVGNRAAFLWVLEANPRAQAFYARNGYRPDGATKIEELIFDAPIIRMVRSEAAETAARPVRPAIWPRGAQIVDGAQTSVVLVLVVVEPGQPGGQPLDGHLELGVQVDEGAATGRRATPG